MSWYPHVLYYYPLSYDTSNIVQTVINGDPDKNGFTFDIELHLSVGSVFLNHSNISSARVENRPISSCINLMQNLLFKAFINLDLIFRQNLFPVMSQDNARFRIENIYSNF